jgi:hypothetical protein
MPKKSLHYKLTPFFININTLSTLYEGCKGLRQLDKIRKLRDLKDQTPNPLSDHTTPPWQIPPMLSISYSGEAWPTQKLEQGGRYFSEQTRILKNIVLLLVKDWEIMKKMYLA